jgi:hypothetical protein
MKSQELEAIGIRVLSSSKPLWSGPAYSELEHSKNSTKLLDIQYFLV